MAADTPEPQLVMTGQSRFAGDAVVVEFTRMIVETESQQRTMLRLSLEPTGGGRRDLPLRQGRAIAWIAEALAPLLVDLVRPDRHLLR